MGDVVDEVVVGVDVGGTTTRVGVARRDGAVLAVVEGPGANPNTVGIPATAARIRELSTSALRDAGRAGADVVAMTIGLAGGTRVLATADLLADVRRAATPAGTTVVPDIVLDVAAAFSAGSPADAGIVLVAGTGSIAAAVDRGRVERRAGGWGWLLGDEGSGFWVGREAVRHVLGRSESTRPGDDGPLTAAVLAAYGVSAAGDLLPAVYAAGEPAAGSVPAPPSQRLAALSAEVAALVDLDPAAAAIVAAAVERLVELPGRLEPDRPEAPLVLAGSLLTTPGPVAHGVRERLAGHGRRVTVAGAAVVGPLWLAIRSLGPAEDGFHRRLDREVGTRRR